MAVALCLGLGVVPWPVRGQDDDCQVECDVEQQACLDGCEGNEFCEEDCADDAANCRMRCGPEMPAAPTCLEGCDESQRTCTEECGSDEECVEACAEQGEECRVDCPYE